MRLRTRVFELAASQGYPSDRQLAFAMGVDPATVSRARSGKGQFRSEFILGALRAFPGKTLDDLFYVENLEEPR